MPLASADIALVQEAVAPPSALIEPEFVFPGHAEWRTEGGSRKFSVAVADLKHSGRLRQLPHSSMAGSGQIVVSRLGTLAVVEIELADEEPITVISCYAVWEKPMTGSWIYADASAHRLISDISALIGTQKNHRIIVAGDLNILYGYGENGSQYWEKRYMTIFDRMEAIGLPFVGPQYPCGDQANPWPLELPMNSKNVPTFRTQKSNPATATRQLDFVFASTSLTSRLHVSALNSEASWGVSDHCQVLIELD